MSLEIISDRETVEASLSAEIEASNQPRSNILARKSATPIRESDAILMENARTLIGHREFQLALSLLRSVLSRSPYYAPAIRRIGICHRELGRMEHALKCFHSLVKVEGTSENLILLAETLYIFERDSEALRAYQTALLDIDIPLGQLFDVYKNLGNIFVRHRDLDAAEEYYNKAFAIRPESDVLAVNYGTLEIQRDNFDKALAHFRDAIEKNPENDKAWVGLALVHRQMGDQDLSRANVERALDIMPKNRTALKLLVEWGVTDFKFSNVIERLQQYLALDSEDVEMSFALAKIFAHLGRLAEAEIELHRVIALDPETPSAADLMAAVRRARHENMVAA